MCGPQRKCAEQLRSFDRFTEMTMPAKLPAFRAIHERMRAPDRLRILLSPFPHTLISVSIPARKLSPLLRLILERFLETALPFCFLLGKGSLHH